MEGLLIRIHQFSVLGDKCQRYLRIVDVFLFLNPFTFPFPEICLKRARRHKIRPAYLDALVYGEHPEDIPLLVNNRTNDMIIVIKNGYLKSVGEGKGASERYDHGGRLRSKTKTKQ